MKRSSREELRVDFLEMYSRLVDDSEPSGGQLKVVQSTNQSQFDQAWKIPGAYVVSQTIGALPRADIAESNLIGSSRGIELTRRIE